MNKLFSIAQSNARLDDVFESLSAQASFASAEDLAMRNIIKA